MLSIPPKGSVSYASEAADCFMVARNWYAKPQTIATIKNLASEVQSWLIRNKAKTDDFGDEKTSERWLPAVGYTEDEDRLDLRRSALRSLLYGNGLRRLLNRMMDDKLLASSARQFVPEATDFTSMAVYEALVGLYVVNASPISLSDMAVRYGLSDDTNPTKLRNRRLVRMATFGLWTVKPDVPFAISLGPVACIFHQEVFSPVRKHFEPHLSGIKE